MDLVLGTMYFGTRTEPAAAFAMLDRYVAAGGRVLDTANCYSFWSSPTGHGGQSEEVIGRWLALNPGLRDELVVATKVGVEPTEDGVEGLSAEVIEREFIRSRERLGVEVVDLYWAHGEDRSTDLEETVTAFGRLAQSGSVRRLGVSNHPTWRVERGRSIAHRLGLEPWTALQLTTSYLEARPGAHVPGKDHPFGFVTPETVDYLAEQPELELWVYSPLLQGGYDRADRSIPEPYSHPATSARLEVLQHVAATHDVPRSRVVLAWLMARGWKPIIGVSTLDQLDSALAAAQLELTAEEFEALDRPR
jgi:aryl-alcohol dehydrogenase-like predicted oxidoreductase